MSLWHVLLFRYSITFYNRNIALIFSVECYVVEKSNPTTVGVQLPIKSSLIKLFNNSVSMELWSNVLMNMNFIIFYCIVWSGNVLYCMICNVLYCMVCNVWYVMYGM